MRMLSRIFSRQLSKALSSTSMQAKPKAVIGYFEKLCSIPHDSGNTKMISDYLVSFVWAFPGRSTSLRSVMCGSFATVQPC